jgi:hypothetical protein
MPISMNSLFASIVATPAGADCSSSASCSTRSSRHPLDIGLHALALNLKTTTGSGHCTQAATPLSRIVNDGICACSTHLILTVLGMRTPAETLWVHAGDHKVARDSHGRDLNGFGRRMTYVCNLNIEAENKVLIIGTERQGVPQPQSQPLRRRASLGVARRAPARCEDSRILLRG